MLFKKMLRDMGRHKTQFVSIFIMAFLAVFIYTGVGGEWIGLVHSSDDFYKATNLADVWVYGNNFSDEQEEAVSEVEGVKSVERRLVLDATADFDNNPNIAMHFVEKNQISKLYLVEGEEFDVNDSEGIWLDKRFCDAKNLSLGETITLTVNGYKIDKEIKGVIYSSEYLYRSDTEGITPDFSANGYAYLSYKAFPVPEGLVYSTLLIKTDDNVNMDQLEESVSDALDGKYSVFLERKNHPSVNMFANEIEQHRMMGDIFPVVFLAIALLTMMTTMTRMVTAQRIQIGTLKALGFKKGVILRHYISYGFWLSLAGAVLGAIVGPLTLPHLFYPSMSGFYTLPEWKSAFDISFVLMSGIVVVSCTLVTYLVCRRLLGDMPAKTLRPKAPKVTRHGLLERTRLWQKLGFNSWWNVRDASRNKIRSLMAIVGVFGCTALLVCAFGMYNGMEGLKVWQYEEINQFESKLTVEETATDEQIMNAKEAVSGELVMEDSVEIRANDRKKTASLTVTDQVTLITPTDKNRNAITLPADGISLTYKMAESLGVHKGDVIEWHIYGDDEWIESTVAEIYREPVNQGISMSREHFEDLGYQFMATGILSPEKVEEHFPGISSILSNQDMMESWEELTGAMMTMVYILILAACTLSIIVLYNLGLLSFTEMEREMATLKVMGLKTRKLRGLLLTQNIWFSIIGFAVGVPGGLVLVEVMVSSSGESFDFPVGLDLFNFLLSFAITFGLSILVNLLFSKKIKRLNMVEVLKGVE